MLSRDTTIVVIGTVTCGRASCFIISVSRVFTASAASFASLMMSTDVSRRGLFSFSPWLLLFSEEVTIEAKTLVASRSDKTRAFLVVSWLMPVGGYLKSGAAFLLLPLSSLYPSDFLLSEFGSDSDELQMQLVLRGNPFGNVKTVTFGLALQNVIQFVRLQSWIRSLDAFRLLLKAIFFEGRRGRLGYAWSSLCRNKVLVSSHACFEGFYEVFCRWYVMKTLSLT